jgi:hypothetical protein
VLYSAIFATAAVLDAGQKDFRRKALSRRLEEAQLASIVEDEKVESFGAARSTEPTKIARVQHHSPLNSSTKHVRQSHFPINRRSAFARTTRNYSTVSWQPNVSAGYKDYSLARSNYFWIANVRDFDRSALGLGSTVLTAQACAELCCDLIKGLERQAASDRKRQAQDSKELLIGQASLADHLTTIRDAMNERLKKANGTSMESATMIALTRKKLSQLFKSHEQASKRDGKIYLDQVVSDVCHAILRSDAIDEEVLSQVIHGFSKLGLDYFSIIIINSFTSRQLSFEHMFKSAESWSRFVKASLAVFSKIQYRRQFVKFTEWMKTCYNANKTLRQKFFDTQSGHHDTAVVKNLPDESEKWVKDVYLALIESSMSLGYLRKGELYLLSLRKRGDKPGLSHITAMLKGYATLYEDLYGIKKKNSIQFDASHLWLEALQVFQVQLLAKGDKVNQNLKMQLATAAHWYIAVCQATDNKELIQDTHVEALEAGVSTGMIKMAGNLCDPAQQDATIHREAALLKKARRQQQREQDQKPVKPATVVRESKVDVSRHYRTFNMPLEVFNSSRVMTIAAS